jgi:hypothetical protein
MSIYRFKLSSQITDELNSFVSINKFCIPQDFKDNWDKWVKTKSEIINIETKRLEKLGYGGDIKEKMYRSARYYLKNKSDNKIKPIKRKKYIRLSKPLRVYMDTHIDRIIQSLKPSEGLELFMNMSEIQQLIKSEMTEKNVNKDEMNNKIKKMYKNRYYIKQKKSD